MDWDTAIVGLIIIIICIAPFVIMYYNQIKNERKMLQSLNEIAQQHNGNVSQHELCGDFVMGLDENKNYVFFFKQKNAETVAQFVDLTEIQTCQIVKKTKNVKNDKIGLGFTERVEIGFIPINKDKGETRLVLYENELNMQLSGELKFVDKWERILNDRLKNKK